MVLLHCFGFFFSEEDEGKEVLIKGKKVKGIGLGMNIFAGGVPKLKATKRTGSQDELSPPIPGLRVSKSFLHNKQDTEVNLIHIMA